MLRTIGKTLFIAITSIGLAHNALASEQLHGGASAATMWWVIFNAADNCTASPGSAVRCGSVDVFGAAFLESVASGSPDPSLIAPNLDAKLAVVFATGGVTDQAGKLRFVASVYKSQPDAPMTLAPGTDPMGLGRALENANAEIHLVVRDHGLAVHGDLVAQFTNFLDPYCSDPNLLYFAGKNTCADVQFAVFGPGQSGTTSVQAFADPATPLPKSRATLLRDGDVIRAVVETRLAVTR